MNSLLLAVIGLIVLYIGYKGYGGVIDRLWGTDETKETPAHVLDDGEDYVPVKHWSILFGHHFASIAGAGPIIGPVIACFYWGWAGVFIWLLFGSIFLGAVHDFSALIVSMRENGSSIASVCNSMFGRNTQIIFSIFLWLSLILVVAVFAAVGAMTFAAKPEIVLPALGIIPVAVIIGLLFYKTRLSQTPVTILGLALLVGLIILGKNFPISFEGVVSNPVKLWIVVLLVYAFIASILPVNLLLQPRDYLSTFLLFFGLVSGYLGILLTRPVMNAPAFIGFTGDKGPFWPMMFVIVACGAISGFHSVVSSGTTSKQISNEKDTKRIGFGAMITESALGILALIAVAAGLKWIPAQGAGPLYGEAMKKGWIMAFSEGFGELTKIMFGSFGVLIAATILNSFIITTLDTATRITRYITEELFSLKNKYLSTSIVILLAMTLAFGNWKMIWPVFGASNQLVAAITLLVVSSYLMNKGKRTEYTMIPAFLMLITSSGALFWQFTNFLKAKNYLLSVIAIVLLLLALYMVFTTLIYFNKERKRLHGKS